MSINCDLMLLYYLNQSTHKPWHSIFVTLYTILIMSAFMFNSLVFIAACRRITNVEHRTGNKRASRYILIAHLCAFDVLLTFTMPVTAVDALTKFWPFGFETEILCKLSKSASAAVVYATSMIIILIAIDSFRQISCPSENQLSSSCFYKITPLILILAILMAAPLFVFTRLIQPEEVQSTRKEYSIEEISTTSSSIATTNYLESHHIYLNETSHDVPLCLSSNHTSSINPLSYDKDVNKTEKCPLVNHGKEMDWSHVVYCVEDWQWKSKGDYDSIHRVYYSIFCILIQHFIPFVTVSVLYYRVYQSFRQTHVIRQFILNMSNQNTQRREYERAKAINRTLVAISMVYCFCWFPLNFIGVLLDAKPDIFGSSTELMIIIFMSCHIVGMSSACINPIIYGYFHEHIREGNYISFYKWLISLLHFIFSCKKYQLYEHYFFISELKTIRKEIIHGGRRFLENVYYRIRITRHSSESFELNHR